MRPTRWSCFQTSKVCVRLFKLASAIALATLRARNRRTKTRTFFPSRNRSSNCSTRVSTCLGGSAGNVSGDTPKVSQARTIVRDSALYHVNTQN